MGCAGGLRLGIGAMGVPGARVRGGVGQHFPRLGSRSGRGLPLNRHRYVVSAKIGARWVAFGIWTNTAAWPSTSDQYCTAR